jgi:hypothetical protein
MGDTGSLALGGIIAVLPFYPQEILLPILCGIFFVENLSVMLQVGYFKYTKRNTVRERIFKMATLHHHFQKKGYVSQKYYAFLDYCNNVSCCYHNHVKNSLMKKKITILGCGESGMGAALLAKDKGFDVFVSDSSPLKTNINNRF